MEPSRNGPAFTLGARHERTLDSAINLVELLRVMGRATQGVRLISLRGKDAIAAVCKVPKSDEEEELNDEMGDDIQEGTPASDDDAPATDNPDAGDA